VPGLFAASTTARHAHVEINIAYLDHGSVAFVESPKSSSAHKLLQAKGILGERTRSIVTPALTTIEFSGGIAT
jgi:hypothetical protein